MSGDGESATPGQRAAAEAEASPAPAAPTWQLPAIVPFGGNWASYEDEIYAIFRKDFLGKPLMWRDKRVTVKGEPRLNGKEDGFWHVATKTGPSGEPDDRLPEIERCERIRWIRAVLEAPNDKVRVFGQMRQGYQHIAIALEDFSYIVFLRQWPDSYQLMSAYSVAYSGKRADYRKQWEADKR